MEVTEPNNSSNNVESKTKKHFSTMGHKVDTEKLRALLREVFQIDHSAAIGIRLIKLIEVFNIYVFYHRNAEFVLENHVKRIMIFLVIISCKAKR